MTAVVLRTCLVCCLLGALLGGAPGRIFGGSTIAQERADNLPPLELDAIDPGLWSVNELLAAPGQVLRITNRGVQPHTFTVLEWGVDIPLPTLETVEVIVPLDARPGETFTFFCNEPGHRAQGQEGVVTIITPEEAAAVSGTPDATGGPSTAQVVVTTNDDFSFSPAAFEVEPGAIIQVRNDGAIEHHFAVDEWGVNETISSGEVKLVQVPEDLEPGQTFTFYCSVPGHRAGGMEGTVTIVEPPAAGPGTGGPAATTVRRSTKDLERFLPNPSIFGPGWSQVRVGNARAVLPEVDSLNVAIFPGEGRGVTLVGPSGARATVVVLPFASTSAPANQIDEAVLNVQLAMMAEWETNLNASQSLDAIAPPRGCDSATRVEGITRIYTLPAGSTVCQLRAAGIAIFVAVEGAVGDISSVEAADEIILRLLQVA